ncbi:MAG: fasciclin domain-containing protein, partial [Pseudomonadota bacterium]
MQRRFVLKSGLALAALGAAGCAQQEEGNDIVDIVESDPRFSTLLAAIAASGLEPELRSPGPMTVFAPVDDAFNELPSRFVAQALLPENRDLLQEVLKYHVVPGAITSDQVIGQRLSVETLEGSNVIVDGRSGGKYGATVRVNDANVIQPDIIASNGVIHVIDKVLIPALPES